MVRIMPRNCSWLLLPVKLRRIHKMTVKLVELGGIHKTTVNGNWRVQLSSFWPSVCDCIGTTSDFHILLLFFRPIVFFFSRSFCLLQRERKRALKRRERSCVSGWRISFFAHFISHNFLNNWEQCAPERDESEAHAAVFLAPFFPPPLQHDDILDPLLHSDEIASGWCSLKALLMDGFVCQTTVPVCNFALVGFETGVLEVRKKGEADSCFLHALIDVICIWWGASAAPKDCALHKKSATNWKENKLFPQEWIRSCIYLQEWAPFVRHNFQLFLG